MRYSRFSHRHLLRIRGCFVVRGGGAILAEQVPPPCSNGGRWFTTVGQLREAVLAAWGVLAEVRARSSIESLPYACRVFYADSLAAEMDARVKLARA